MDSSINVGLICGWAVFCFPQYLSQFAWSILNAFVFENCVSWTGNWEPSRTSFLPSYREARRMKWSSSWEPRSLRRLWFHFSFSNSRQCSTAAVAWKLLWSGRKSLWELSVRSCSLTCLGCVVVCSSFSADVLLTSVVSSKFSLWLSWGPMLDPEPVLSCWRTIEAGQLVVLGDQAVGWSRLGLLYGKIMN